MSTMHITSIVFSVRLVCRLYGTFVRPTQSVEIFGNVSMPFGTLAHPLTSRWNFTKIVPGEPLRRGGGKHKRGSQI